MSKAQVKITLKGAQATAAMDALIREARVAFEGTYNRKIYDLQEYGCSDELARQMVWMALCEFHAGAARWRAQETKGETL